MSSAPADAVAVVLDNGTFRGAGEVVLPVIVVCAAAVY
jgi:hypothetical protein